MYDPVIAADGKTYERRAIITWLDDAESRKITHYSPFRIDVENEKFQDDDGWILRPNTELALRIRAYLDTEPVEDQAKEVWKNDLKDYEEYEILEEGLKKTEQEFTERIMAEIEILDKKFNKNLDEIYAMMRKFEEDRHYRRRQGS